MSTPLSSLRKARKMPLHHGSYGDRSMPFRQQGYAADDNKLLDEVTGGMAASKLRSRDSTIVGLPKLRDSVSRTSNSTASSAHATPAMSRSTTWAASGSAEDTKTETPNDHDLMSMMMSRLGQLETRLQSQTKEIVEKDKKIKVLEDKVKLLHHARAADDGSPGRIQELEKKCLLMQQQVHEMEAFLADYGMVWVGEKTDPDSEVYYEEELRRLSDTPDSQPLEDLWRPDTSVPEPDFQVDFDLLIKNLQELNVIAGEGIAKIQHTTDGARLRMTDPIPLTVFANGIAMFSGPFRPFTDKITQEFIKDIMDGYFPSELQIRYPDGVPFKVTDKRRVYFKDRLTEVFQGQGQMLGGDTKPSRLVPSNLTKDKSTMAEEYEETSELPGHKLSTDQFLNRLPASVIKDGKVISIRDQVKHSIQGDEGTTDVTLVNTSSVQEMKNRLEVDEKERPRSSRNVTTLRIKSEEGNHTYILKMKFTETIGDLRKYLNQQRKHKGGYEIASAFPKQTYSDDKATLQHCGLVPNAALHLRPHRQ